MFFRFFNGEFLNTRKCIWSSTEPVRRDFLSYIPHFSFIKTDVMRLIIKMQYQSLGTKRAIYFGNSKTFGKYEEGNTIELRCPNGTLNPIIGQNNINGFLSMIKCAKSSNFDENTVNRRLYTMEKLSNNSIENDSNNYNLIYLEQVIELVDVLFDNNLNKINFLRQYIKDGQVVEKGKALKKSHRFTKIIR